MVETGCLSSVGNSGLGLGRIVRRRSPVRGIGFSTGRSFGAIERTPTTFVLDRKGQLAKVFRGRIGAELWDDVAELVLL